MEKKDFDINVAKVKDAINADKLVVFAGAGVSADSGIPLWGEIIKKIKDQYLNVKQDENDFLKTAQILYNERGEKEYNEIIKELVFRKSLRYNPVHEILFELNPEHIITTNYDYFFENVIKDKGFPFSVISKDNDLPYAKHKNLLIKYHGDFKNRNTVFKETDYLEFSLNNPLKETFVKALFSNKIILFVGYGVGDINLKYLIREMQFILKENHQRSYLLVLDEKPKSEIQYFENLGINVICYPEISKSIPSEIKIKLSSKGEIVYKQLNYIKRFDLFRYEREKSNSDDQVSKFIDDLYESLIVFKHFRVIPKSFLIRLYPLSGNIHFWFFNDSVITIIKDEIYDFLKNYKGKEDKKLKKEQKEKLNYSLGKLTFSNINWLSLPKNKAKPSIPKLDSAISLVNNYEEDSYRFDFIDKIIGEFKYSDALKEIEKYRITEESDIWHDLVYSYSLYLVCEYYDSFRSFEQLEMKANNREQMDISFLCKYNMKQIGSHIGTYWSFDERYSFNELKQITKKAKKIDLDIQLSQAKPFLNENLYELLKEIHRGVYIQKLCNEIDEIATKIPDDIENIKSGGSSSGNKFIKLHNATLQLNHLIYGNLIVGNGFSTIKYTLDKSIRTFILGYSIGEIQLSKSQEVFGVTKVKSFSQFLFILLIDYNGKPKELRNFITRNNIDDIIFNEDHISIITNLINNFFQSSFEKKKSLSGYKASDIFKNKSQYNSNFYTKIVKQFKNICIVLTYFKFDEKEIREIYPNLNRYLKFSSNLGKHSFLEFLPNFIHKKHELIGENLLIETLEIFQKKKLYNSVYISTLKSIKHLNSNFFNDEIDLDLFDFRRFNNGIPVIYDCLSSKRQKKFIDIIEGDFENTIDEGIIYNILSANISVKNKFKEQYKKGRLKSLERAGRVAPNGSRIMFDPNSFTRYFWLVYEGKLKEEKLKSLDVKPEILNFIIDPENYDPKKFQVKWLKIYYYLPFIKKFSKVNYIFESLEEYLTEYEDGKLSLIYFRLKKERKINADRVGRD